MLNVSNDSWHMKVYRWWYYQAQETPFTGKSINLCPYMRAVLLWTPLWCIFGDQFRIFGITTNWVTVPAFLFTIAKLAGYVSFDLKLIMSVFFSAVLVTAVLIFFIEQWKKVSRRNRIFRCAEIKQPSPFVELTKAWFKSAHDNVCPIINIDGLPDVGEEEDYQAPSPRESADKAIDEIMKP